MQPSELQQDFIRELTTGENPVIVLNAKAGSGKTTTIRMGAERLPKYKSKLCLAFNSSIQKELAVKLSHISFTEVRTSHSLGKKILLQNGIKHELDIQKYHKLAEWLNRKHWKLNTQVTEQNTRYKSILKLADHARLCYTSDVGEIKALSEKHALPLKDEDIEKVLDLMRLGYNQRDVIDFTDMIFLPTGLKGIVYPQYDYVFVDECQDLSVLQQTLIKKVVKPGGKLIFVGDPHQAIYGFAGADTESFSKLLDMPGAAELPLDVCYRCGTDIIDLTQTYVPEITAAPTMPKGQVDHKAKVDTIVDGDMVLCRNTLPLVALCFKFIAEGKAAYVKGKNIGAKLAAYIDRLRAGKIDNVPNAMVEDLKEYEKMLQGFNPGLHPDEVRELNAYIFRREQMNIVRVILDNNTFRNIKALKEYVRTLFKDDGRGIVLSTVHKAKGLENDRVFIIEKYLLPSKRAKQQWQKDQERNLVYVAYTRAINYLGFVSDWTIQKQGSRFQRFATDAEKKVYTDDDYSRLEEKAKTSFIN